MSIANRVQTKARAISNKIDWKCRDFLFAIGANKDCLKTRPGAVIIAYHGIDKVGRKDLNSKFISIKYFEKQIIYFRKNFNIVPLSCFFNGGLDPTKFNVALTFDDGYENNYNYAYPIIEKYQVPITLFITGIRDYGGDILWPDCLDVGSKYTNVKAVDIQGIKFRRDLRGVFRSIEDGKPLKQYGKESSEVFNQELIDVFKSISNFRKYPSLNDYWRQMSIKQIRCISKSGLVSIGSHSYYHNNMNEIDFRDACVEIKKTKSYLEGIIQKEVSSFAYPYGLYNDDLIQYSGELGHTEQLALGYLNREDESKPLIKDRFGINPYISWNNQLSCLFKGAY